MILLSVVDKSRIAYILNKFNYTHFFILLVSIFICGCTPTNNKIQNNNISSASPNDHKILSKPQIKVASIEKVDNLISAKNIKTYKLKNVKVCYPLVIKGIVSPELGKEVDVAPRITGRIKQILVSPGQEVTKMQPLAIIDSSEISNLQAELIEAKSKYEIAKAAQEREEQVYNEQILRPKALIAAKTAYNENKVQANLAQTNLNRVEGLYKEKILAAKDYLNAKAQYQKAQVLLEQSLSDLQREEQLFKNKSIMQKDFQMSQAETTRAKDHFDTLYQRLKFMGMTTAMLEELLKTRTITGQVQLVSPVSGLVSNFDASAGETINAEQTLLKVTDLSNVQIKAFLPESDLNLIKYDMVVGITVSSFPELSFTGKIDYISDRVDRNNGSILFGILIPNKKNLLKTNMTACVYIKTPEVLSLACPKSAIHIHNGRKYIYVQTGKIYKETLITTGKENNKYFEILSGAKLGDIIALKSDETLKLEKDSSTFCAF